MGATASPSSDRLQWEKIFKIMLETVKSHQYENESLADRCKYLEDYIAIVKKHWSSRAQSLESQISQMKKEGQMRSRVVAAKMKLEEGFSERKALFVKKQLELAESDLEDFRVCMETVSTELSELKGKLKSREADQVEDQVEAGDNLNRLKDQKEKEVTIASLEREIRRLKHDHRKLISKKESEISALLAEKDFVWNQFNKADNDYTSLVKTRRIEVEQANESVEILQANVENLESLIEDKDAKIATLEAERAKLKLEIRRCTQEAEKTNEKVEKLELNVRELQSSVKEKDKINAKLNSDLMKIKLNSTKYTDQKHTFSKESDSHKYSGNGLFTPNSSRPRRGFEKTSFKTGNVTDIRKRKCVNANGDTFGHVASVPTNGPRRCSARLLQKSNVSPEKETPRLFSATLRVPKLKAAVPPPSL